MDQLFYFLILIFSIILHEVAHGYMANHLGDPTARLLGRLTLNPISHIDPLGSIMIPAFLVFTGSPVLFGYAKPVPYNPDNLPGTYDELLVAGAGPGTNILLALIFGLVIRFAGDALGASLANAFAIIVIVNLWLALFNLIPLPPLDGSKVLAGILPGALGRAYADLRYSLERLGVFGGTLIVLLVFYFIFAPFLVALLRTLFALLTGVSL